MTRKLDPRTGFQELESKYNKLFGLFFNLSLVSNLLKFDLHSSFIVSKMIVKY